MRNPPVQPGVPGVASALGRHPGPAGCRKAALRIQCVTVLALAAAVVSLRRSAGWIAVAGWAAVALTTAALTVEELAEFKRTPSATRMPGAPVAGPGESAGRGVCAGDASARVRAGGLRAADSESRWVFALARGHRAWMPRGERWRWSLEETGVQRNPAIGLAAQRGVRRRIPCSAVAGAARFLDRLRRGRAAALRSHSSSAPLVEAQAPYTDVGTFGLSLHRQEAVVQEIRMPATPVQSFRRFNCGRSGRAGTARVRETPGPKGRRSSCWRLPALERH